MPIPRRRRAIALLPLVLLAALGACTFVQPRYPALPPGPFRGVLELEYNPIVPNPKGAPIPEKTDLEFEEITQGQLPFNFDVVYLTDTSFRIDIHNGKETITVPPEDIRWGRDRSVGRDTIRIDFPVYDTHISAYYEENVIEGVWVVHYRDNYRIPFKGYFGKDHRFTVMNKPPVADLSGAWAVEFTEANGDGYPGIAEFTQRGNELTGTFRTETGDYRYLAGTVQGPRLYLSVFDGAHAFLFEGQLSEDGTLTGSFRSGRHYLANWAARRDDAFALADPDTLTRLVEDAPLAFRFPDANGDTISLDDPRFAGKPKLITIFGTWCPNCRDEAEFLKDYLANHDTGDLRVIGLAFERYGPDDERSRTALRRYAERMKVPWPLLLAGSSDKGAAGRALPMLNRVISYPTLLFLDRSNRVTRIHTGFNGPATSEFAAFRTSFDASVRQLITPDEAG